MTYIAIAYAIDILELFVLRFKNGKLWLVPYPQQGLSLYCLLLHLINHITSPFIMDAIISGPAYEASAINELALFLMAPRASPVIALICAFIPGWSGFGAQHLVSEPICLGLASFPSPRAWVDAIAAVVVLRHVIPLQHEVCGGGRVEDNEAALARHILELGLGDSWALFVDEGVETGGLEAVLDLGAHGGRETVFDDDDDHDVGEALFFKAEADSYAYGFIGLTLDGKLQ